MAKKSARSKGYRKTVTPKPYLSKKEIAILIAIIAAIILGIVLFNLLYDDGSLKVENGVAQVQGENSLIVNVGSSNNPRYFKLGQTAPVEGYTLVSEPVGSDENVTHSVYTPVEDSPIGEITVEAVTYKADLIASSIQAAYASAEGGVCSDLAEADLDGRKVQYFTFHSTQPSKTEDSAEEPTEAETFTPSQNLFAFVPAGERSITIKVRVAAETEADYVDDSILIDALNQILPSLTFETH